MNRIIKFNAWLPELQYMLEDVALGHGSIGFPFIDEPEDDFYQFLKSKGFISDDVDNLPPYLYDSQEAWCSIDDEKQFIVLQFTGLKDKNGIDIYEGDILRHSSGGNFINRAIDFKDGGFMITSDEGGRYYPYGSEAIGNIYQNPELLTL